MHKELLRYKVFHSKDAETLKANLQELAAADPLNAGPWIRLGDLSLRDAPLEEIQRYYAHALSILAQRRERFTEPAIQRGIDAQRDVLRGVQELLPYYVANRATLVLRAESEGGKRYVLADRQTAAVKRVVQER